MNQALDQDLLGSIRGLHLAVLDLSIALKQPVVTPRLDRLIAAVGKLGGTRPARSPTGIEESVRQWKDYLDDKIESLALRSIRNLCWHPETATSDTFQYYLDRHTVSLSSRALQGLVRSCHARWSPEFAAGATPKRVRARMERYNGPSRLLAKWKAASEMILGKDGAEHFGKEMVRGGIAIKELCTAWGIADGFSP